MSSDHRTVEHLVMQIMVTGRKDGQRIMGDDTWILIPNDQK